MLQVVLLVEDDSTSEVVKYDFYTEEGDELYSLWSNIESVDDIPSTTKVWWCGEIVEVSQDKVKGLYIDADSDENNFSGWSGSDDSDSSPNDSAGESNGSNGSDGYYDSDGDWIDSNGTSDSDDSNYLNSTNNYIYMSLYKN